MARERVSVLTSDEVEALRTAFDKIPAPRDLQHRLRLKNLAKIGSLTITLILLSFGQITPHDTLMVLREEQRQAQAEPTWVTLQRFPLAISIDVAWPAPDLAMPSLALLSLPITTAPNTMKPITQASLIRRGADPSSGNPSRQGVGRATGSAQSGTTGSSSANTNSSTNPTSSPKPAIKTAQNNPLATLVSHFFSGFKPLSPFQGGDANPNKNQQSQTGRDAMSRAIEQARSTNSDSRGSGFGSNSFSGLKKG